MGEYRAVAIRNSSFSHEETPMPVLSPSSPVDSFTHLETLFPSMYRSPEDGIAMIFRSKKGCAILSSQFGSNIQAHSLRTDAVTNPLAVAKERLEHKGFSPVIVATQKLFETFASLFATAGFTEQQVTAAMQICDR
jgi:hypothetical protein